MRSANRRFPVVLAPLFVTVSAFSVAVPPPNVYE